MGHKWNIKFLLRLLVFEIILNDIIDFILLINASGIVSENQNILIFINGVMLGYLVEVIDQNR